MTNRKGFARRVRGLRSSPIFLIVLLGVGIFTVPPLYSLIETSVRSIDGQFTFDNYISIVDDPQFWSLLLNTLAFAIGSSLIGLIIGTSAAWLVERTDSPFRNASYLFAFLSIAVPGVIQVMGWSLFLGSKAGIVVVALRNIFGPDVPAYQVNSLGGMILVQGVHWAPVVFFLMVIPFRSMDSRLEESAIMSGASRFQVFARISLRLAWPSIFAALTLGFIRAVEAFEVPAIIGIPGGVRVVTSQIFLVMETSLRPQYGPASAYGVGMLVVLVGLLGYYSRQTKRSSRFAVITGKGLNIERIKLGKWRPVGALICLVLPVAASIPIAVMIWASLLPFYEPPSRAALAALTLENYSSVFASGPFMASLLNTAIVAVGSATIAAVLTFAVAWVLTRSSLPARGLLDLLVSLGLTFPGLVAGIAVLRAYIRSFVPIYGTVWILIAAYVLRFMPYAMRYNHAAFLQIHKELDESAKVAGATVWKRTILVTLPLVAPALFAAWIFVFLVSAGEFAVAILLSGPRNQVVSALLYQQWVSGSIPTIAAFSVVFVFGVVIIGFGFFRLGRRVGFQVA